MKNEDEGVEVNLEQSETERSDADDTDSADEWRKIRSIFYVYI